MKLKGLKKAKSITREEVFEKAVSKLKEEKPGDPSLVLILGKEVSRALVVWLNVKRKILDDAPTKSDPWDMIRYSLTDWMDLAGVRGWKTQRNVENTIRVNNLAYPDGTLPSSVNTYLIQQGREILGID
jgi:hypothetical protein